MSIGAKSSHVAKSSLAPGQWGITTQEYWLAEIIKNCNTSFTLEKH